MTEGIRSAIRLVLTRASGHFAKALTVNPGGGPCLVLAPHSDDEALGCAHVIGQMRDRGRQVIVIIVTDGSACQVARHMGTQHVIELRRQESLAACRHLGVEEHCVKFLDFRDGTLKQHIPAVKAELAAFCREISPAVIFCPFAHDMHPDHAALAQAMAELAAEGAFQGTILEYPIWTSLAWNWRLITAPAFRRRLRKVTAAHRTQKKQALAEYHSQRRNALGSGIDGALSAGFERLFTGPDEVFIGTALEI